ncbi:MAG: TatD family hydrolase [Oscillospiraceae bacterium]|jgi:TatD DNase family protein|nr:TatD family hydrolase [Oscillospiraceae bacterium]
MNLIFDAHAHYQDKAFDNDRALLLNRLPKLGVSAVVNSSTDLESAKKTLKLCKEYDFLFAGVGIHPLSVRDIEKSYEEKIKNMLNEDQNIVCIGEIGLDYYHDPESKEEQKKLFEKQIEISLDFNLPIVVHDRLAHEDTVLILQEYKPKGMIHCFSGDLKMAKEIVDLGMYLSFGGMVTFKNSGDLEEVVSNIPIDRILLETDAPYLAPEPYRSKRCDSSFIPLIAQKISNIRGISLEELLWTTKENACDLFNIAF